MRVTNVARRFLAVLLAPDRSEEEVWVLPHETGVLGPEGVGPASLLLEFHECGLHVGDDLVGEYRSQHPADDQPVCDVASSLTRVLGRCFR